MTMAELRKQLPAAPRAESAAALHKRLLPGLRVRHDGWTAPRLKRFLGALGQTGCLKDSARIAGLSVKSAYDLKRRFPAFAGAIEEALGEAQQGLIAVAHRYATQGKETVIIRNGEEVERRIAPDTATLGLLIKRGDNGAVQDPETGKFVPRAEAEARGLVRPLGLAGGLAGAAIPPGHIVVDPAKVLTEAEYDAGYIFATIGFNKPPITGKVHQDSLEIARGRVIAKVRKMRARIREHDRYENICRTCKQGLPPGRFDELWPPGEVEAD